MEETSEVADLYIDARFKSYTVLNAVTSPVSSTLVEVLPNKQCCGSL
uniref:Uncharacterized protein n=1 Tax=Anguilla anguilla TaxID=7936 RepID=A0A0E9VHZ4_ANGAN